VGNRVPPLCPDPGSIPVFILYLQLSGGALLGVGLWTLLAKSHYVSLLATATFTATTYILIATGCTVFILGIIGCVGALKEKRVLLMIVSTPILLQFAPTIPSLRTTHSLLFVPNRYYSI
jgi:hypothetical protein